MRQFLRLDDIDMNRGSTKAMSAEDQEGLKRMEHSVCVVDGQYEVDMLWKSDTPVPAKQQANDRSKNAGFNETRRSTERTESLWRTSLKKRKDAIFSTPPCISSSKERQNSCCV